MQEQIRVANHRIQDLEEGRALKEKLAKLIDVKSLMTLALTAGFIGLTCSGEVSGQEYMSIFTMIVGFISEPRQRKQENRKRGKKR